MLTFAFDHIVHYVKKPQKVIPFLKERGIYAAVGGEHQRRPTHNVLSYFDLSYIEFIGTSNKEKLRQMDHGPYSMIQTIIDSRFTEGFKRFVLRTNDIKAAKEHFVKMGLHVHGPIPLSRKKPDESVLEWQLLFIGESNSELEFPYIIQWGKKDAKLRNDLVSDGVIVDGSSQPQFSHIKIAVNDLAKTVARWSSLFHLSVEQPYVDNEIQATCQTLHLCGGNITFCMPIGAGLVSSILKSNGNVPFQVSLTGETNENFTLFGGRYEIKRK